MTEYTLLHVRRFTFWSQIHFAVLSITFLALLECPLLINTIPKSHAAKPNTGANSNSFFAKNVVLCGVACSMTNISKELWWFATIMKFFPLRVLKISIPWISERILNSLTRDLYTTPEQRWKFPTSNGWNAPTKLQHIAKNIIKQLKLKYFVRNRKLFDFLYRAMHPIKRPRSPDTTITTNFNCHITFWRWFSWRARECSKTSQDAMVCWNPRSSRAPRKHISSTCSENFSSEHRKALFSGKVGASYDIIFIPSCEFVGFNRLRGYRSSKYERKIGSCFRQLRTVVVGTAKSNASPGEAIFDPKKCHFAIRSPSPSKMKHG